ncbi:MAG: hypothetical protein KKH75_01950 [Actinobacteria bacterium]|nr:hypothetical protein [Actinomycetota bacterium]
MDLPYAEVEFDKAGELVTPPQVSAAAALIASEKATDVLVLSHGWNNSPAQARDLYERLIHSVASVGGRVAASANRRLVVIGVIWPSILWAPPEDQGAGAGLEDDVAALQDDIRARIDDAVVAKKLVALVPQLETSSDAQREYLALLRKTLPTSSPGEDVGAFTALTTASEDTVLEAAKALGQDDAVPAAAGGAADVDPMGTGLVGEGAGAGLGLFGDIIGVGRNLLNVTTYYTMKERAGKVGSIGIAALLEGLHAAAPAVRLHLAGHSFGGRAVTAAALATKAPVSSMSLLQAAYSHFGMAYNWDGAGTDGFFEKAPANVHGPIIVTHSTHDKAVGVAYPIASRLANQIGAGLGDESDPYGGIGRNGALKTPGNIMAQLLDVGGTYSLAQRQIWSLNGDAFISGHSDITGPQVAYAVLTAITT